MGWTRVSPHIAPAAFQTRENQEISENVFLAGIVQLISLATAIRHEMTRKNCSEFPSCSKLKPAIFSSELIWQTGALPCAEQEPSGDRQDYVVNDKGEAVGWSSTPIYSSWYHKTISPCAIDLEFAEPGTELIVKWGDFGGKIKDVRVTVAKFPYIDADDNRDYPIDTVEHGDVK